MKDHDQSTDPTPLIGVTETNQEKSLHSGCRVLPVTLHAPAERQIIKDLIYLLGLFYRHVHSGYLCLSGLVGLSK